MLKVNTHTVGEVTVVRCAGRLYAEDGERLRQAVESGRPAAVSVLDLAEITAIDAGGVGLLVSLQSWCRQRGARLKLMNLTPRVERVLEVTRLRGVLEVCSVKDVLDLMCRAIHEAQSRAEVPTLVRAHIGLGAGELFERERCGD